MIRDSRILEQMSYISAAVEQQGKKKKQKQNYLQNFHFTFQSSMKLVLEVNQIWKTWKKPHLFTHAMQRPFFQNQHTDTI